MLDDVSHDAPAAWLNIKRDVHRRPEANGMAMTRDSGSAFLFGWRERLLTRVTTSVKRWAIIHER